MSLNRQSFKGYNRGCDQPNVANEILFDDVDYYTWCEWGDDDYDDYDGYYWEDDLQCFRDHESDEEFYNVALKEFELEMMRY